MEAKKENFTEVEIEVLTALVSKFKAVINCKATNTASNRAKEQAWEKLCLEFNSTAGVRRRTVKQLVGKYRNMKKAALKNKAQDKLTLYQTGGGPGELRSTPIDEQLAAMGAVVQPSECDLDCDDKYEKRVASQSKKWQYSFKF